jgi:hypothetical protein
MAHTKGRATGDQGAHPNTVAPEDVGSSTRQDSKAHEDTTTETKELETPSRVFIGTAATNGQAASGNGTENSEGRQAEEGPPAQERKSAPQDDGGQSDVHPEVEADGGVKQGAGGNTVSKDAGKSDEKDVRSQETITEKSRKGSVTDKDLNKADVEAADEKGLGGGDRWLEVGAGAKREGGYRLWLQVAVATVCFVAAAIIVYKRTLERAPAGDPAERVVILSGSRSGLLGR